MKMFFTFLAILGLVSGCASFNIDRGVEQNLFYSSFPDVELCIDPTFRYLRYEQSSTDERENLDRGNERFRGPFWKDSDSYIFREDEYDREIDKLIILQFNKLRNDRGFYLVKWPPEMPCIDYGKMELAGRSFRYIIYMKEGITADQNKTDRALWITAFDIGIRHSFNIHYYEKMKDSAPSYYNVSNKTTLFGERLEYVNSLKERFQEAIKMPDNGKCGDSAH